MQRNCVKCGALFDGRYCKACKKISVIKYRATRSEMLAAAAKKYRANHLENGNIRAAKWRADHPEKSKAVSAKYRLLHREKELKRKRIAMVKWRAKNPGKARAAYAEWLAKNPQAKRVLEQNREARKRKNGGKLSKGLVEKLFKLQKGKCPCCGKNLGDKYQLDHKMPIALGGPNEDWNMQLLRSLCNNQKQAKHPVDFMQSRGFLL